MQAVRVKLMLEEVAKIDDMLNHIPMSEVFGESKVVKWPVLFGGSFDIFAGKIFHGGKIK